MTMPLADSGINEWLVKLRPLIDQTCFEFIDVSYFGAVNNKISKTIYQIFNPTNLLNHVAPTTEFLTVTFSILQQFGTSAITAVVWW